MNRNDHLPEINRIQMLARQAGAERSLYMGEAIGNALAIAWNGIGSLGAWIGKAAARLVAARGRTKGPGRAISP